MLSNVGPASHVAVPASASALASAVSQAAPQVDPHELTQADKVGGIVGATVLGAGLGYGGMMLGAKLGADFGMSLLAGQPGAVQAFVGVAAAIQYAAIGTMVVGALGATVGIVGGWFAGKALAHKIA